MHGQQNIKTYLVSYRKLRQSRMNGQRILFCKKVNGEHGDAASRPEFSVGK